MNEDEDYPLPPKKKRECLSARDLEYQKQYSEWLTALTREEREQLAEKGLESFEVSYREREKTPHVLVSNDARKTAFNSSDPDKPDIVDNYTPFDVIAAEEPSPVISAVTKDHVEGASQVLSILFDRVDENLLGMREVALRAYCLCYLLAPHLIKGATESKIGKIFKCSRQVISARVKRIEEQTGLHNANQKSSRACNIYSARMTEVWRERKEKERRERKKQKAAEWRARNKEKIKAYADEYRSKHKLRLRLSKAKSRLRHRDKINAKKRAAYRRGKAKKQTPPNIQGSN